MHAVNILIPPPPPEKKGKKEISYSIKAKTEDNYTEMHVYNNSLCQIELS